MKKSKLKAMLEDAQQSSFRNAKRAVEAEREVRDLRRAVAEMREKWRPVPIAHPWQPKNPQCALCDEPKDSPRHQLDTPGVNPA